MNFYPNVPNMFIPVNNGNMFENPVMYINDMMNKFNEFENRIKKLEQRIMRLENQNNGNDYNYTEPDNSLYMI